MLLSFLLPLFCGSIAIGVVLGVGRFILGTFLNSFPLYSRLALAALGGQFFVCLVMNVALTLGFGSPTDLRILFWCLAAIAVAGQFRKLPKLFPPIPKFIGRGIVLGALVVAYAANLMIALAPSTKIDELTYHMLIARRVIWDQGLKFYRLPIEAAITPQMQYQLSLSMAHAFHVPDAGNLLSLFYSLALILFIAGIAADLTASLSIGWLTACFCGVGIYHSVLHTTSGPHALGALATVVATALVLWPNRYKSGTQTGRYVLLVGGVAALAAASKISLWPLAALLSVLIAVNAASRSATRLALFLAFAIVPWFLLHAPLLIWTYLHSGSPFGPVLANVFGPSIFTADFLQILNDMQKVNQAPWGWVRYTVAELSPVFLLAFPALIYCALRRSRIAGAALALLAVQLGLIFWKLPYEFRFLGGLEYIAVIVSISELVRLAPRTLGSNTVLRCNRLHPELLTRGLVCCFALPWLVGQIYFALPFAKVVLGVTSRPQFLSRYVGMYSDFVRLDGVLPREAVLWIPLGRIANAYSPRPVALTYLDLPVDKPVFKFTFEDQALPEHEQPALLRCDEVVYENGASIVESYRTPGRAPKIAPISVRRCLRIPSNN